MDNDTFIASITSASTIVSAFGAAYLTNYLNNKKQRIMKKIYLLMI